MAGSKSRKLAGKRTVRLAFLLTLVLLMVLFVKAVSLREKRLELQRKQALLEATLSEEEAKNEELNGEKNRELTEEEIFEIARKRLGLLFPNEIFFIPEDQ